MENTVVWEVISILEEPLAPVDSVDDTGNQWRTEGGSTPLPEIPKALQTRAKLNPIVKTVKNC